MTLTNERTVIDYLRSEATRVSVRDTLDDIERGVRIVSVASPHERRRPTLLLVGAAASVAVVAGLALMGNEGNPDRADTPADSPSVPVEADTIVTPATEPTTPTTTAAPTTTLASVPLPAGGRILGIVPSCTSTDSVVYDCTIPEFPEPGVGTAVDYTDFGTVIVDDTSHVSGGCRSTVADATRFTCYVGQRAIDENVVHPEGLGEWSPQGYVAG
jgi:hypothetical protein